MKFKTTELVDVIGNLPILETGELSSDGGLLTQSFEVFLVANGFEDRSTAVTLGLADAGAKFRAACFFSYDRNHDDNARTFADLRTGLDRLSADVSSIDASLPDGVFDEIVRAVIDAAAVDGTCRVLFDASGATSRLIMRVLRVLFLLARSSQTDVDLTVAYSQAKSYFPTAPEADEIVAKMTTSGFEAATLGLDYEADELTYLVEHPGQHIDFLPERAVVLCGFNADRVRASLDKIDTVFNIDAPHARVSYVVGEPPLEEDKWRKDAMIKINSAGLTNGNIIPYVTSTLQYHETLSLLERIYEDSFGRERITIIPFGSKMQTLAVSLFCEVHPDVRVQILAPARYNGAHYSSGVRSSHKLHFGSLARISTLFRSIGSIHEITD